MLTLLFRWETKTQEASLISIGIAMVNGEEYLGMERSARAKRLAVTVQ